MSDETRAAAERRTAYLAGKSCDPYMIDTDLKTLADAYLSEHPADAELITPEFTCEECGGNMCIWWGDGPYVFAFPMSQRHIAASLTDELNKRRAALGLPLTPPSPTSTQ